MSGRKRSRAAVDSSELGVIKLADGHSLPADLLALRVFSSCARGLPVTTQEWDLSGFQIDGQAVKRETVTAWLTCVVHHATEVTDDSSNVMTSATGLYELLAFADAVGSSDGVLHACISRVQDLQLSAQLGQQDVGCPGVKSLQLLTDGRVNYWETGETEETGPVLMRS